MVERLSSVWTPFAKFVFAPGFAAFATWQTGFLLFTPAGPDLTTLTLNLWRVFTAVNWFVLMVLLYKWGLCLTKVAVRDDMLIVSNYFQQVEVLVSELESVKGGYSFLFNLIWLRFRRDTRIGDRAVFMAKGRAFLWQKHPVLLRLRAELVGQEEGGQPSMTHLRPGG